MLQELTARKNRNSSYSLRAFARDLGVSPAALSQYLGRKRELSPKNRRSIADRMKLSPLEQKAFTLKTGDPLERTDTHEAVSEDRFRLIGSWLSLAILNLARLDGNQANVDWIADRLVVPVEEAREVFERLLRLELIEIKSGRMVRTTQPLTTTSDVPSEAIKKYHLGLLRKVELALLDLPVSERDITAITMPTDPEKLLEAKKILKRTHHRIAKLVGTSKASEVYVLSTQLFPLTKKRKMG